jgi:hypothetical protein
MRFCARCVRRLCRFGHRQVTSARVEHVTSDACWRSRSILDVIFRFSDKLKTLTPQRNQATWPITFLSREEPGTSAA